MEMAADVGNGKYFKRKRKTSGIHHKVYGRTIQIQGKRTERLGEEEKSEWEKWEKREGK